jgi:hypothetical protein
MISGVSSQSINDVFSATYDNYQIVINLSLSSATYAGIRMRVSGTDNSSSNYIFAGPSLTSGNSFENLWSNGTVTSFNEMVRISVNNSAGTFVISDPFNTKATTIVGQSVWNRSATLINSMTYTGVTTVTTSYTGFTLLPQTGTMTGSVSVYGINK